MVYTIWSFRQPLYIFRIVFKNGTATILKKKLYINGEPPVAGIFRHKIIKI